MSIDKTWHAPSGDSQRVKWDLKPPIFLALVWHSLEPLRYCIEAYKHDVDPSM